MQESWNARCIMSFVTTHSWQDLGNATRTAMAMGSASRENAAASLDLRVKTATNVSVLKARATYAAATAFVQRTDCVNVKLAILALTAPQPAVTNSAASMAEYATTEFVNSAAQTTQATPAKTAAISSPASDCAGTYSWASPKGNTAPQASHPSCSN